MNFNAHNHQHGLDPSTSYYMGVLEHVKTYSSDRLMTECGVDTLAADEVGFTGTNYLWDVLGYREKTSGYSSYYPMAGMLLRDKVLLYQHDLAHETFTNNLSMLRWNLAMGYNLSVLMGDPWVEVVGVFQRYLLSKYCDELVKNYSELGDGLFLTEFESYRVYSNWNTANSMVVGNNRISADGVMAVSVDGSVQGGVFDSYNAHQLSGPGHYIIENRTDKVIRLFHPDSEDTRISVKAGPAWKSAKVRAFKYDGTPIGEVKSDLSKGLISFNCMNVISSLKVDYYEITEK
jgi:hypothetical protein